MKNKELDKILELYVSYNKLYKDLCEGGVLDPHQGAVFSANNCCLLNLFLEACKR